MANNEQNGSAATSQIQVGALLDLEREIGK